MTVIRTPAEIVSVMETQRVAQTRKIFEEINVSILEAAEQCRRFSEVLLPAFTPAEVRNKILAEIGASGWDGWIRSTGGPREETWLLQIDLRPYYEFIEKSQETTQVPLSDSTKSP